MHEFLTKAPEAGCLTVLTLQVRKPRHRILVKGMGVGSNDPALSATVMATNLITPLLRLMDPPTEKKLFP